jgi:SAM-dependent methyltransferase
MTSTAQAAGAGYEVFAPFYDAFTAGSDYDAWTTRVLELASHYGLGGRRHLDAACGTGKSFMPLLERGFEVTATDASPAMLAEAARKAPAVPLVEADVRALPRLGAFDLVTCFDDSLNHLLEESDLAAALASLARNLAADDGLLLFDLNTLLAYRTTFALDSVAERDGAVFAWRGGSSPDAAPGCLASARIDVFAGRDGCWERHAVAFEQRHFPPHRVTALMAAAGLECLAVCGVLADGAPVAEVDESTQLKVLYAARLAKGGDPE